MESKGKIILYFIIVILVDLFISFIIFMAISSARGMTIQHPGNADLFAEVFLITFLIAFLPIMLIVGIAWLYAR
ncbi:MAG: hypothetical protein EU539_08215 [Promethearchaeota archaeon]|nr:MAG: hypothetical protein EU539_08215 [Candidatus Lokiarchaeota archaeon]